MTVDLWMTRDPMTIAATSTISAAARKMAHRKVRRLVVVDADQRQAVYRQAQTEAKRDRRGIWEKPGSQQDPAAWRRLNPR